MWRITIPAAWLLVFLTTDAIAQKTGVKPDEGLPVGALLRLGSLTLNHPLGTYCVAFSPDGSLLASGCGERIRFWDVKTGDLVSELPVGATAMSFSLDGTRLATGKGYGRSHKMGQIQLWNLEEAETIFQKEKAHGTLARKNVKPEVFFPKEITGIIFAPDGKTFSTVSRGNFVRSWDVKSGKEVRTLMASTTHRQGTGFALSTDGRFLAAVDRNTIHLWDLQQNDQPRLITVETQGPAFKWSSLFDLTRIIHESL